jgi:xanthine dehydrogenase YagS FAD-binding subunit
LVTWVFVPATAAAARSRYLKIRDRTSYAFALASCAAALEVANGRIQVARMALGGVGTKPWRSLEAERMLVGEPPRPEAFRRAADVALRDARPRRDNAFKVELAKRTAVRALTLSAEGA